MPTAQPGHGCVRPNSFAATHEFRRHPTPRAARGDPILGWSPRATATPTFHVKPPTALASATVWPVRPTEALQLSGACKSGAALCVMHKVGLAATRPNPGIGMLGEGARPAPPRSQLRRGAMAHTTTQAGGVASGLTPATHARGGASCVSRETHGPVTRRANVAARAALQHRRPANPSRDARNRRRTDEQQSDPTLRHLVARHRARAHSEQFRSMTRWPRRSPRFT